MNAIAWDDGDIVILDQTVLPHAQEFRRLTSTAEVAEAIRSLRIRGAPALGIAGAMGVAQAAVKTISSSTRVVLAAAEEAAATLRATRPTAVNLGWAIDRVLDLGRSLVASAGVARMRRALVDQALAIQAEDRAACAAMAEHALTFFEPRSTVLTHCNTGGLVTGGTGTAFGAIRLAYERGLEIAVVVTETRPLLQGARLTAWELGRLGIPHAVVVDAAAPGLIARGEVALVVVGADRIAANGDVANKVGTYPLALAAREAGVPFVVVAPTSSVDLSTPTAASIEVEERDPSEVLRVLGAVTIAPSGATALNPAFDLTPAALVSAIVTERGVARAPLGESLAAQFGRGRPRSRRKPKKPARRRPQPAKTARVAATRRSAAKGAKTKRSAPKGGGTSIRTKTKRPTPKGRGKRR